MPDFQDQLEQLLADPDFSRVIKLTAKEVMRGWNISYEVAQGFVLSAIGEPKALACIYDAWITAKRDGQSLGKAKVIVRRRVFDLLIRDARRAGHTSLPVVDDDGDEQASIELSDHDPRHNPREQVAHRQIIELVRAAIGSFATQGCVQKRQARLLQRHILDEIPYPELSAELACTQSALRVRVHKAIKAFRKHIQDVDRWLL
jgi:hypothetical protein